MKISISVDAWQVGKAVPEWLAPYIADKQGTVTYESNTMSRTLAPTDWVLRVGSNTLFFTNDEYRALSPRQNVTHLSLNAQLPASVTIRNT